MRSIETSTVSAGLATQELASRAPFVVELSGTPGAGKSSTIARVADELIAQGLRVIVVEEGIRESPLRQHGLARMNLGVATEKLDRVRAAREARAADVILLDRGPHDLAVLGAVLHAIGKVSTTERAAFEALAQARRYLIDDVVVLVADPAIAMTRHGYANGEEGGQVMNPRTIANWKTQAVLAAHQQLNVPLLDTTTLQPEQIDRFLVERIELLLRVSPN